MSTTRQRTLLAVGLVVLLLALVIGWGLNGGAGAPTAAGTATTAGTATKAGAATTATSASATRSPSGLPVCTSVPDEVDDTVAAVRANGPYLRPRNDGGTFGNRERLLPARPSGYYREYTVEAPGERFPGPRRLITGGQAKLGAEPTSWFYTDDHYESFCELRL